jgi:hypothetical protein
MEVFNCPLSNAVDFVYQAEPLTEEEQVQKEAHLVDGFPD